MASYSTGWVPQHHRDITLGRLDSYLNKDMFSDANIIKTLNVHKEVSCISLWVHSVPKDTPNPSFSEATSSQADFTPTSVGSKFGPSWTTHWFRLCITVPDEWEALSDTPLLLSWDSGSEAMVWTEDGEPQQGITDNRNEYMLSSHVQPGQNFTLYIEMACNGMFGTTDGIKPPAEDRFFTLKEVALVVPNLKARQLYFDLLVLSDLARSLPADSAAGVDALYTANKFVNTFRPDVPSTWEAARKIAASYLSRAPVAEHQHTISSAKQAAAATASPDSCVSTSAQCGNMKPTAAAASGCSMSTSNIKWQRKVLAIGHCHIDTAWLWPFSETRRKTARSWSSQLKLMEQYPEHTFTASSAQQYEWLQQDYPGLFERIQSAAAKKHFIPVGGTWVEMDANMPSGEALVRQFLYGQRFFEKNFGVRSEVFWLPDTFGYAAQLPQLVKGAGMKYFLTQKLSWNNINTFPHNTFMWQALDGSQVLTHFPPANTYGSQMSTTDVWNSVRNNKDKDRSPSSLLLFGAGDGGGGPTAEMLERVRRLSGAASRVVTSAHKDKGDCSSPCLRCQSDTQLEGEGGGAAGELPVLKMSGPTAFFQDLEAESRDLLTWQGELYFELHRGTYTSHAANKAFNRKCELLLREVELAGSLALVLNSSYTYPREQVDEIWKDVLLYQFHDVLPGSAIGRVYNVALARYAIMVHQLLELREAALAAALHSNSLCLPTLKAEAGSTCCSLQAHEIQGALPFVSHATSTAAAAASKQHEVTLYQQTSSAVNALTPLQGLPLTPLQGLPSKLQLLHLMNSGYTSTALYPAILAEAAPSPPPFFFNSLGFPRTEVVSVPMEALPPGTQAPQWTDSGTKALYLINAPAMSLSPLPMPQHQLQSAGCMPNNGSHATSHGSHATGHDQVQLTAAASLQENHCPLKAWVEVHTLQTAIMMQPPYFDASALHRPATMLPPCKDDMVYVLQNNFIRAVFDSSGRLTSLFDKQWLRELVQPGGLGNRFRMYEDIPTFWDAWDIEATHLEKSWDAGDPESATAQGSNPLEKLPGPIPGASVEVVESGPLRVAIRVEFALSSQSRLVQTIQLSACSQRLDFEVEVDWFENRVALKAEFPWELKSDVATYETQFGAVQRPTHQNTSWDWAKFEVCGHRFSDLSEPDYGVALLNDCKYGHATHGHVMRITLLRSPKCPDANTDMGHHIMRYAVLPHAYGWQAGGVVTAALGFNQPLVMVPGGASTPSLIGDPESPLMGRFGGLSTPVLQVSSTRPTTSFPSASIPPLIIDTLKPAEEPIISFNSKSGSPDMKAAAAANVVAGSSSNKRQTDIMTGGLTALVVRMYEPHGSRGYAKLSWDPMILKVQKVVPCNLLEDDLVMEAGEATVPITTSHDEPYISNRLAGSSFSMPASTFGASATSSGQRQDYFLFEYSPFKVLTFKLFVLTA
ncbi:hypothetical protein CEUSTIGMA_g4048.t1 [Chlamydomonas eustigma]|uniref:alpha-mannosidase n=1 Tax=Chlamydomonas eustigma TaxID=1157962 RepID=A0A250X139_9CHLO|nr:hypothetical protein CEUSTIGMA_g4048.t1 [Chlamydomonas eustigma]|eukprot:GAX76602.1 hypothetical protein CEUSTIGMA_g4048.t1 [Chlamydomonas eustigma]